MTNQKEVKFFNLKIIFFADFLHSPLEIYLKRFPIIIHLVHLKERSGLIRARLKGSEMAKGKVRKNFF